MSTPYAKKEYLRIRIPMKVRSEKTRLKQKGRKMVITMKNAMSL